MAGLDYNLPFCKSPIVDLKCLIQVETPCHWSGSWVLILMFEETDLPVLALEHR